MKFILHSIILLSIAPANIHAQPPFAIGDTIRGTVWVIDGDSIRLTHDDYRKSEVRIFGINAPETHTKAGKSAKYFLIDTVKSGNRTASCYIIDIDRYKRYVSHCMLHTHSGTIDIGYHMLQNQHAQYYGTYMHLPSVPQGLQHTYAQYK